MRYLLLSDVHANLGALENVLNHAQAHGWDAVISLGDTVGYGDAPDASLDVLRSLSPYVALLGNHEVALIGALSGVKQPRAPNYQTTHAHSSELSELNQNFIREMHRSHLDARWGAVHGALRDPWEYLISVPVARANEPLMRRPLYFVGHTHVPGIFARDESHSRWYSLVCRSEQLAFTLKPGGSAFVNPGSVGQPRDGLGPSYAIYDEKGQHIELFRLPL